MTTHLVNRNAINRCAVDAPMTRRRAASWSACRIARTLVIAMSLCGLMSARLARLAVAAPAQRPNILFIFTDDLAWQAIHAYGESRALLDTPNLDRIAREGMRFNRCLVTNSICGPSRAVILTGKYSHRNGFYNNSNSRFDGRQTTFPKLLQAAGYQTALIGKWHLVSDPTGFDHWHILPGQGVYYNPPMLDHGRRVEHAGYTTDVITDLSLEWLKGRDPAKPFLLMCQHKAPHREGEPGHALPGARPRSRCIPSRRLCSTTIPVAARPNASRT